MSAAACSACYGSGYGVDDKPCPCGCRPAPAIAPPVAAGSVDTPEFQRLAELWRYAPAGTREFMAAWDGQIAHIDAWGAQQRVSGRQDEAARIRHLTYERDQFRTAQGVALNAVADLRQRAEKAESRVKELESAIDSARNYEIPCGADDLLDEALASVTDVKASRQALQAEGKHPAPCARHCEANAFRIEVRRLEAVELDLHRKLASEKLRADQGWARYDAANRAKNDLEREKAAAYQRGNVAAAAILDHVKPAGIVGSGPNAKEGDRPCWTPDCGTF